MDNNQSDENKKPKLFQFKYNSNPLSRHQGQNQGYGSEKKFSLTSKSSQSKIQLRSSAIKPLKRADSTSDNFFHTASTKSSMGPRTAGAADRKYMKFDGFELLSRQTDAFKKFEPIGRTLQTYQQTRKSFNANNSTQKEGGTRIKASSNTYSAYTGGIQKLQRANSQNQVTQNNFMKTTEGFGNKRIFNYVKNNNNSSAKNNEQKQNAQLTNRKNITNNSTNNKNSNSNNNTNANTNTNTNNSNTTQSNNNFNFKTGSDKECDNNNNQNNSSNNNNNKQVNHTNSNQQQGKFNFINREKKKNITIKKKLSDAMNKANYYNDEVIKKQQIFVQQEKEEEEQFLELCDVLNQL